VTSIGKCMVMTNEVSIGNTRWLSCDGGQNRM